MATPTVSRTMAEVDTALVQARWAFLHTTWAMNDELAAKTQRQLDDLLELRSP